jgi:hypothetical protein
MGFPTMFEAFESLFFAGVAGIFLYHAWLGWRTRIVRFPVSVLAVEEIERDRSPLNFWMVMAADLLGSTLALVAAAWIAWTTLAPFARPVERLQSLNGCYEGEGLPDFMRPPVHWAFRIADGVIFDRSGKAVSKVSLAGRTSTSTSLVFSPGIFLADDEHKESMVYPGDTMSGKAYLSGNLARIALADEWGDVMQTTSCG